MKVLSKLLVILTIITLSLVIIPKKVFAKGVWEEAINSAESFIKNADDPSTVINEGNMKEFSNSVYNALLIFGVVTAVVIGAVLGIKFMVSSVEDQANIKNTLIIYVIGCIVVFGAFTIWKIVTNLLVKA